MNAVSLNSLWTYIQSLSLTESNRRWLASKLTEPSQAQKMTDQAIKADLKEAFRQLEEVKSGKRQTRSAEELLYEL